MPATAKVVTQQKGVTTNTDDEHISEDDMSDNNENDDHIQSFLEMYGIQAGKSLEVEVKRLILTSSIDSLTSFRNYLYLCRPAFNTLCQLAQVALTIAVTS